MHFSTGPSKPAPVGLPGAGDGEKRPSRSHVTAINRIAGGIGMLGGAALVVLAFLAEGIENQVFLGLLGFGLILAGIVVFAFVPRAWARRLQVEDERFDRVMAKLDEIHETLKELEEKPRNNGVAIADFLGTGMKWYSDYVSRNKEEGKDADA